MNNEEKQLKRLNNSQIFIADWGGLEQHDSKTCWKEIPS
jgi:hypothetical protein